MKLYPILLGALILQVILFLPPFGIMRVWYKPDDSVFDQVDGRGIGPYIHYKFWTGAMVDGIDYGGPEIGFVSFYLGNITLDVILVVLVLFVKRIEKDI